MISLHIRLLGQSSWKIMIVASNCSMMVPRHRLPIWKWFQLWVPTAHTQEVKEKMTMFLVCIINCKFSWCIKEETVSLWFTKTNHSVYDYHSKNIIFVLNSTSSLILTALCTIFHYLTHYKFSYQYFYPYVTFEKQWFLK